MGPRRDNRLEGVAFGLGFEENGVGGKDEEDVTEKERKGAKPKTEEGFIGIYPIKEHHLIHTI